MRTYKLSSLLLLITILVTVLAGCSPSPVNNANNETGKSPTFTTISAEEAKKIMDSGDAYILVDVRTQEEFDEKHIDGALLIPNETIGTEPVELLPDKDAKILVYCRSGNRSRQASEKLVALGYTQIIDFGGIVDWPYETVSQ